MKKYCVAYTSCYDNDLVQAVVEAETFFDAVMAAGHATEEDRSSCPTIEDMKQHLFDGDMLISVIEI